MVKLKNIQIKNLTQVKKRKNNNNNKKTLDQIWQNRKLKEDQVKKKPNFRT